MAAFEFPAWAAVLFGPKAAPARPDLPTQPAPELETLAIIKKKPGRPPGKYGNYKPRKKQTG